jgi:hypothetical protein
MTSLQHVYEVRPRKDHRGVDLISDVLPFGRLWYGGPNVVSNAVDWRLLFTGDRVHDQRGPSNPCHEILRRSRT